MPERARLDYIDWLRIIAVALLLPFHTARVFDIFETNYVKNGVLSAPLTYIVSFLNVWQMPLLFVLAGMATSLALGWRSGGQYMQERVRRLVVPLVFGVLVIVPPQSYLGAVTHVDYAGSFLQWYPNFFHLDLSDLTGYAGGFTPGHLWFIVYLVVFSFAALPLFLWLRRPPGRVALARAASLLSRPGVIFLPALPLAVTGLLPDVGGKNPFTDILLFIFGYMLIADERVLQAVDRHRWWTLGVALPLTALYCVVTVNGLFAGARFSAADVSIYMIRTLAAWSWIVALIGLGRRYLTAGGPVLRYAREASYPVYILHQTVIVVLAYFIVTWPVGVAVKYVAILVAASAGTLLLYELTVRRFDLVRVAFGMKPRGRARPAELERLETAP